MNVKLNDIYEIVKTAYPDKLVVINPDREVTDTSQVRSGTVGNSWKFNMVYDESDKVINVIDINIQFRCEAVGTV